MGLFGPVDIGKRGRRFRWPDAAGLYSACNDSRHARATFALITKEDVAHC